MTKRIQPTHFIEVWKFKIDFYNSIIYTIDKLDYNINFTKEMKCETIAIWKIKFKK